jgi:hypothetical protein
MSDWNESSRTRMLVGGDVAVEEVSVRVGWGDGRLVGAAACRVPTAPLLVAEEAIDVGMKRREVVSEHVPDGLAGLGMRVERRAQRFRVYSLDD